MEHILSPPWVYEEDVMGRHSNWKRILERNLTEVEKRADLTDDQKVALVTRLCSGASGAPVQG